MKISFRQARLAMAVSVVLLAVGVFTAGGSGQPAAAMSPTSGVPVTQATSPLESWSAPIDVSNSGWYDNTPWIGAVPGGGVTIGYEERDERGGSFTSVQQVSNTSLNGAFRAPEEVDNGSGSLKGRNVRVATDQLGRRYIAWWTITGGSTCGSFARVDADGISRVNDILEFTCQPSSNGRKNVALAVGLDGSAHVLFGRDQNNIYYSQMNPAGVWVVQNELVNNNTFPKNIAIGVTSTGIAMAAWVGNSNIQVSVRQPNGTWPAPENVSRMVCPGQGLSAHLPALARDNVGGMRLAWSQVQCPFNDPGWDEVYYREWTSAGGWGPDTAIANPSLQNGGQSYNPGLTVDSDGNAHIMWSDDTGRNRSQFELYYAKGRLSTGFTNYGAIFRSYFGADYQKEASLDQNPPGTAPAAVHVAFGSNRNDSQKENWYSYALTGGQPVVTPTPTRTNTPVVQPTPCTLGRYSDVHPEDYYYVAAYELARAGVMSGYSDCTFRPGNNITRGQTAKIVVLGSGRPLNCPGNGHFSDVPASNPFFCYVETAYNADIISGYADGTFRPGNNVTRAQFSKMVQKAFNIPIDTTGGPHFTDVSTTDPFYNYIETLYNNNLISGYSDHTFRPGNNLTRGQGAKITYEARRLTGNDNTPTGTAIVVTTTPTDTPVVFTATATVTAIVVTTTPTNTPLVFTATPTATNTPGAVPEGERS
jgi:hypothetical protein